MRFQDCVFFATIALAIPVVAYAGDCKFDNTGGNYPSTANDPHLSSEGPLNGDICGHSVWATSGTCYFKVVNSDSISSGTCLTVGKGVVLTTDGVNNTLSCTSTSCGVAIQASSSSGTGATATSVSGVNIEGCFGIGAQGRGTTTSFSEGMVDLTPAGSWCGGSNIGLDGWGEIDTTIVAVANTGVQMNTGTISNSIVKDSGYGVYAANNVVLDNVLLEDNTTSVLGDGASYKGSMESSVVQSASSCHCAHNTGGWPATVCQTDIGDCVDFAGQPSMVDSVIRQ